MKYTIEEIEEAFYRYLKTDKIDNVSIANDLWDNFSKCLNDCKEKKPVFKIICGRREGTEKHLDYVYLTNDEYNRLKSEVGIIFLEACIFKLDSYLTNDEGKRRKYKDHNKVIRTWVIRSVREDGLTPIPEKNQTFKYSTPEVEI